jgi:hypothetical protein
MAVSSPTIMRGIFASIAAATTALVACSAGTNNHPSPPTSAEYDIQFPSPQVAAGVDSVQTWVFAKATAGTDCASLIVDLKNGTPLPADAAHTDPVALCDLFNQKAGSIPDVVYGDIVVLVSAPRGGNPYLGGCALGTLSASSSPVSVVLGPVDFSKPLASTCCASIGGFCSDNACASTSCTDGG